MLLKIEELTQQILSLGTFNHCYFFITTTFPHNTNFRSMLLQRQDTCSIFSRINVKQMLWKCKNIEYGNEGLNNFSYLGGCTGGMRTCYKKTKSYPDKKGEYLDVALGWSWESLLSILFLIKILTHLKLLWRKQVCCHVCVCVYIHILQREIPMTKCCDSVKRSFIWFLLYFSLSANHSEETFPRGNYSLDSWKVCCQILSQPAFHCT